MTHGSLFSGIGGFDLAAEWMGWENVFHCEINPFCQKVLNYYWPNAKSYHDIKSTEFREWRGKVDIISGGFPCQPFSTAGKQLGKNDSRYLWPEMLRAIREIQPRWIVGENVYGIINWSKGLVFEQVQVDLENEGYEVTPYILPACSIGAPHKRDRVWFIAHSNGIRGQRLQCEMGKPEKDRQWRKINETNSQYNVTNAESLRQQGQRRPEKQGDPKENGNWQKYRAFDDGRWPSQPWVRRRNDGVPRKLDGITFSSWAKQSISGYGNAIVPQVVYQIFKAIEQYE